MTALLQKHILILGFSRLHIGVAIILVIVVAQESISLVLFFAFLSDSVGSVLIFILTTLKKLLFLLLFGSLLRSELAHLLGRGVDGPGDSDAENDGLRLLADQFTHEDANERAEEHE